MSKLLIVEDDVTVRETLALNLRAEGFEVVEAADGESGLEVGRSGNFDLVVLDVMLPKLDGLTVCRLLRRESRVPIVLLTARGTEADKIIGLETGADDYIVKPFSLGEFLARVRAALRRGAAAPATTSLESGDLRLDLEGRRAFLRGAQLALAPREFELLATMMRNRGVALTRELLLAASGGRLTTATPARSMCISAGCARRSRPIPPARSASRPSGGVGYRFEG